MAGTTTRNNRHLGALGSSRVRTAVDDLVRLIQGQRGIGECERVKGALDGGLRLVEEMLCWNQSVMPVADKSDS